MSWSIIEAAEVDFQDICVHCGSENLQDVNNNSEYFPHAMPTLPESNQNKKAE